MMISNKKLDANQYNLKDQVVSINRVTKVVKGGKNMSFAALVVVGDAASGVVGYGSGKAKEVPQAIRKGIEAAKKNLVRINLTDTSIPHQVLGRFGSGHVLLKPAPEGTGVIAGGAVRAVMTSVGVQNVLTKSLGTANPHNVIKATFDALLDCPLGDRLAHFLGRGNIAAGLGLQRQRGGRNDGLALLIVNDLRVNMVQRTVDIQARTLGRAGKLGADARVNALPDCVSLVLRNHRCLFSYQRSRPAAPFGEMQ